MSSRCPNCRIELAPSGYCPRCGWPRFTGRLSGVLILIALLLGGYAALGYYFRDSLAPFLQQRQARRAAFPYDVSYPPPSVPPHEASLPKFEDFERTQLQVLTSSRDYPALTAALQRYHDEFDADSLNEDRIIAVFDTFQYPATAGAEPWFDAWITQTPDHFAPYLARGIYFANLGFDSRGEKFASETSEEQLRKMHEYFARARTDLQHALELNPHLLPAYCDLLCMAGADSSEQVVDRLIAQGQELFPDSYNFYATALNFKKPRWGGSYEEMDELATQAIVHVERNPKLYRLFGIIYADQVDRLYRDKDYLRVIEYGPKALAFGNFSDVHFFLARSYLAQKEYALALPSFDQALIAYPANKNTWIARADCYFYLGRMDLALADIQRLLELSPNEPLATQWCQQRLLELNTPEQQAYRQSLLDLIAATSPLPLPKTSAATEVRPAAALQITLKFRAPEGTQPSGLEWHLNHLYLSSYAKKPGIYRLDCRDGSVLATATSPTVSDYRFGGLASDGQTLIHIPANNGLNATRLSLDTLKVRDTFDFRLSQNDLSDLAFYKKSLYLIAPLTSPSQPPYALHRFSLDGKLEQSFAFPFGGEGMQNFGIASDGRWLWVSAGPRLLKIAPEDGNIVAVYPLPLQRTESLAWDGKQLWAATFGGEIYTLKPL